MPRRRLRWVSPSQPPPLLIVLLHPLRMENLGEHRFDLPSATEPHLKFEQARVLGLEAAEHLSGGCDLLGLRSEPPLIARATDCKRTVQLWHGPPPFCGAEPFLPNRRRRRCATRHLQSEHQFQCRPTRPQTDNESDRPEDLDGYVEHRPELRER